MTAACGAGTACLPRYRACLLTFALPPAIYKNRCSPSLRQKALHPRFFGGIERT